MYLRKIQIKNIKCFSSIELDFSAESGVRRWTALLGQNGLGKSTLLQAIAVPLAGTGAIRELMPVAEGWVRQDQPFGEINAELLWTDGDAQLPQWPKKTPYHSHYIVTGANPDLLPETLQDAPTVPAVAEWAGELEARERETITKEMSRLKRTAYAEGKAGWLACGYGPFRRLTGGSQAADRILYSGRRAARFVTLFREDAALTSAAEWLIELHNTSRDGDQQSARSLELVREAFRQEFLLEEATLLVDARSARLQIGSRAPVQFANLSDGYRSVLALGIDLLRWIIEAFPGSESPLSQHGVVLIDELDAHLHPKWQQLIGNWLLKKFPNLQFIVATHSPFLAQIAERGGNVLLGQHDGVVVAQSEPSAVRTWRADQILTELFGLATTRSPEIESRLQRLLALQEKGRQSALSTEEANERKQLELDLDPLPSDLEHAKDRALNDFINKAVDEHEKDVRALK
jgi:hypothetical protein